MSTRPAAGDPPEPASEPAASESAVPGRGGLPSFSGAGASVGAFLAGLEQQIFHRPPPAVVAEEHQRGEDANLDGLTLDPTHEPLERPEPPDRSGARL